MFRKCLSDLTKVVGATIFIGGSVHLTISTPYKKYIALITNVYKNAKQNTKGYGALLRNFDVFIIDY